MFTFTDVLEDVRSVSRRTVTAEAAHSIHTQPIVTDAIKLTLVDICVQYEQTKRLQLYFLYYIFIYIPHTKILATGLVKMQSPSYFAATHPAAAAK